MLRLTNISLTEWRSTRGTIAHYHGLQGHADQPVDLTLPAEGGKVAEIRLSVASLTALRDAANEVLNGTSKHVDISTFSLNLTD